MSANGQSYIAPLLKPCPFCGSKNIDAYGWVSEHSSGPACNDCGASAGAVSGNVEDNIAAWNARAPVAEPDVALLISMATCLNHGFGLLSAHQQKSMLHDMRKLWDEVMGRGYYSPDNRERYLSFCDAIVAEELDRKGEEG